MSNRRIPIRGDIWQEENPNFDNSMDYHAQANQAIEELRASEPGSPEELEQFRIRFLGSKGIIRNLMAAIRDIPADRRKEFGQLVNRLKQMAEARLEDYKARLEPAGDQADMDIDLTLPVRAVRVGTHHPISIIRRKIITIFEGIGFSVADGPEIEDDWHNFTALNIPRDHPSRDMQDTFFIRKNPDIVLRTHTSPVQIRAMMQQAPPIRIISPGTVYRCDNDATHSPVFHQVEGIYIDERVGFTDLRQTLNYFVRQMFGDDVEMRLRPSFFPFTEPSAELDIAWTSEGGRQWMEILGCGMVDPAVLENCHIDSGKYMGFAFGMGIERIAMLKFGIRDIRLFYENDMRFLRQFTGVV